MAKASVNDLRYCFSEVEHLLEKGNEVEITKHKQVIARLLPVRRGAGRRPGFLARLRRIYGDRILGVSGAQERDRY
jgi:antitoxin (DNA-binding transcriptional repressor) of toxin-antitoxin stability system